MVGEGIEKATNNYLLERFLGVTRGEAFALFRSLANGYTLCFDRRHAEAVILERAASYRMDDQNYARIPLGGCDFSGEIGNIIVALSNRCALAEQQLIEAHRIIRALTEVKP